MRLPFEQLQSPMEFQRLCAQVLEAEGCKNIRGLGTGPDQGSDFMVELPITSPLGVDLQRFIVQCKWYSPDRSVGESEVGDVVSYLDLHDAVGLLLITSSQFSGTAVTKMSAIDRATRHPYRVKFWDGHELTKRLRKHPQIITRYWYPSDNKGQAEPRGGQLPAYNEQALLEEYGPPPLYAALSVDSFPKIPGNEQFVIRLREYGEEFAACPPIITVVEGAVGAGKTGYAHALLNQKRLEGYKVAMVPTYNFEAHFFAYALENDNRLPMLLKFWQQVDFLLLDDFGWFLRDKSDTQIQAARTLIDLVQERITANKPTVLAIWADDIGATIRNYLEYLKAHCPVIYVGDVDLRRSLGWSDDLSASNSTIEPVIDAENSQGGVGHFLGRAWLVEKYEIIEDEIDRAIDILVTPEDVYESRQRYMRERFGMQQNRDDEILEILQHAKRRLRGYHNFVDSLDFDALYFKPDGTIEFIERRHRTSGNST